MFTRNLLLMGALTLTPVARFSSPALAAPTTARAKASKANKAPSPGTSATRPALIEAKGEGVTIRLRRARWANSEEVLAWRGRGKALTLWLDAQLDDASRAPLPKGASPADFIVNVRLIDRHGRAIEALPVDPVRLWHRGSLGYVPSKKGFNAPGQSVWRALPFDPNFDAVKLQVEWLKPGHPFDRKSLPPSILELEAPAIPAQASPWLQRIEMEIPEQKIEYGGISRAAPIARASDMRLSADLHVWRKGSYTVTSGEGEGQSEVYFDATLVLRAKDPGDTAILKGLQLTLRGQEGQELKMSQKIDEASQWFGPNGRVLRANERVLAGSFSFRSPTAAPGEATKWTLELQARDGSSLLSLRDLPLPPGFVSRTAPATK